MRKWYIHTIQERLRRHFTRNFSRLADERFVCGEMRYNYQCHRNSVHEYFLDNTKRIALVFAIDRRDDTFCLHVINRLSNGKYQDNTWGSEYLYHSYYLIKEILPDQYDRVPNYFDDHRRDFIRLFGSYWLIRLLRIQPTDIF
ncbi:hypothetical protein GGR92_005269 [Spirosoma lacussanchae]|uniref:hypothetical protein n=1 Tax=Spirosoma lacussanchae TaxID=1884249 RepID=UPI001108A9F9|nr:hypothetical protein [Spirosoma lacussanchae]